MPNRTRFSGGRQRPHTAAVMAQRREDWLTVLTLMVVMALGAAVFVVLP